MFHLQKTDIGLEWPSAEGFKIGDENIETIDSVVYNKEINRLIVTVSRNKKTHQYVFDIISENPRITVDGTSAVGIPSALENPYFHDLFVDLENVELE